MELLTVFTPTYNRKHTIIRTYESLLRQTSKDFCWLIIDDGSSDGTKEWVLSLAESLELRAERFDWMGRRLVEAGISEFRNFGTSEPETSETLKQKKMDHFVIHVPFPDNEGSLRVEYIYKPNGGLYTGYNVAYATIETELCVCIDSDDFMPDDAVEKISKKWHEYYPQGSLTSNLSLLTSKEYCGIIGLDFDINTNKPIGGYFEEGLSEGCVLDHFHSGDAKQVMRTDLMKKVAPQIGFKGEKNFNPIYMLINVCDRYPILFLNENLCTVEYQIGADSMSQGIFNQYVNSPRSFAKMRQQEMNFIHNSMRGRFRSAIHYISSCIFAKDGNWFKNSNRKLLIICAIPFGVMLYAYIKIKTRK